ncbi:MAG: molybdopterin-binding protein, partial [Sediminibacterium sp.]|nr:molybdopterin-binding protein [Sediminibacterium sp.]
MNHFATILTIGDELLIGQVFDTNSAWIAQQLNLLGYQIKQRIAIADNKMDIIQSLESNMGINDLIIITGGLGPTSDDITKMVLNEYFQSKLQLHTPTLNHIQDLFLKRNKTILLERNIQQAYLPDSCKIIQNRLGTAPGMLFKKNNCTIISLPGVPIEMKTIFKEELLPIISLPINSYSIAHKTLITADIVESYLAELLLDFEKNLPANIKLAYLPNHFLVRLRLSCYEINGDNSIILENKWTELIQLVKPYIVSEEDISLEKIIGNLLSQNNKTISTAESCTGGFISHLLTKHSGSSSFYIGSLIAYHNHIKKEHLSVSNEILTTVGVVSI